MPQQEEIEIESIERVVDDDDVIFLKRILSGDEGEVKLIKNSVRNVSMLTRYYASHMAMHLTHELLLSRVFSRTVLEILVPEVDPLFNINGYNGYAQGYDSVSKLQSRFVLWSVSMSGDVKRQQSVVANLLHHAIYPYYGLIHHAVSCSRDDLYPLFFRNGFGVRDVVRRQHPFAEPNLLAIAIGNADVDFVDNWLRQNSSTYESERDILHALAQINVAAFRCNDDGEAITDERRLRECVALLLAIKPNVPGNNRRWRRNNSGEYDGMVDYKRMARIGHSHCRRPQPILDRILSSCTRDGSLLYALRAARKAALFGLNDWLSQTLAFYFYKAEHPVYELVKRRNASLTALWMIGEAEFFNLVRFARKRPIRELDRDDWLDFYDEQLSLNFDSNKIVWSDFFFRFES